jgi:hypothetical protein
MIVEALFGLAGLGFVGRKKVMPPKTTVHDVDVCS